MSLYGKINIDLPSKEDISRGSIERKPITYSVQQTDPKKGSISQEIDEHRRMTSAALQFQPIRRHLQPKKSSKKTPSSAAPSAPLMSHPVFHNISSLDYWTHKDEDLYESYDITESRKIAKNRKKKKKTKDSETVVLSWDDFYDPFRPTDYEEYKMSDESVQEMIDWKNKQEGKSRAQNMEKYKNMEQFAPPTDYSSHSPAAIEFSGPTEPVSAISLDETAEEAYARRVAMSRNRNIDVDYGSSYSIEPVYETNAPKQSSFDPSISLEEPVSVEGSHEASNNALGMSDDKQHLEPFSKATIIREPQMYDIKTTNSSEPISSSMDSQNSEIQESVGFQDKSNMPGQKKFAERLMKKYGWEKGKGLGASNDGIVNPLIVKQSKDRKNTGSIINKNQPEKAGKFGKLSKVILLTNVSELEAVDDELSQEIGDECNKSYGKVERCFIYKNMKSTLASDIVRVFVLFTDTISALRAVNSLNGRLFGGKEVKQVIKVLNMGIHLFKSFIYIFQHMKFVYKGLVLMREWVCCVCQAKNYMDSKGNIQDVPFHAANKNDHLNVHYTVLSADKTELSPFCQTCMKNHLFIVNALASYLPSEEDPDYNIYLSALPSYREFLEQRYPMMCDLCFPHIQEHLAKKNYIAKSMTLGGWLLNSKKISYYRISGKSYYYMFQIFIHIIRAIAEFILSERISDASIYSEISLILFFISIIHLVLIFKCIYFITPTLISLYDPNSTGLSVFSKQKLNTELKMVERKPSDNDKNLSPVLLSNSILKEPQHDVDSSDNFMQLDPPEVVPFKMNTGNTSLYNNPSFGFPKGIKLPLPPKTSMYRVSTLKKKTISYGQNLICLKLIKKMTMGLHLNGSLLLRKQPTGLETIFSPALNLDDDPLIIRALRIVSRHKLTWNEVISVLWALEIMIINILNLGKLSYYSSIIGSFGIACSIATGSLFLRKTYVKLTFIGTIVSFLYYLFIYINHYGDDFEIFLQTSGTFFVYNTLITTFYSCFSLRILWIIRSLWSHTPLKAKQDCPQKQSKIWGKYAYNK
ncbi:hypothetical protein MERGE_002308 [Pneumocystis wakefieldiae]|uniref:G-patch domain-containing protein n=1 Tax=Pneumocystis wakefieldiae TaxID=38082 RepID=A0A899FXI0_9ASCO|nr:hypothetical protein MERGE_002308 [Pneumocystis wakefieldiae]